jgi:hypothetical protein
MSLSVSNGLIKPGFLSLQLHRGIAGSCVFVAYIVFESPEHLKQAFNNPDFQSKISEYPTSTVASPHLFKKVADVGHAPAPDPHIV